MLHPWCHPYCLSISPRRDATHWRRPGLLHCSKGGKTTLLPVVVLRGNHPPVPTCRCRGTLLYLAAGFLRSAAHEGVLRGRISIPNFHSVSDRCRFPLSYSVRSTRVSVSKLSLLSIPVDL